MKIIKDIKLEKPEDGKEKRHERNRKNLDVFKYIGPGLLVTVGFIDPGNWASNFAAGSEFGYTLLWVITLSTNVDNTSA